MSMKDKKPVGREKEPHPKVEKLEDGIAMKKTLPKLRADHSRTGNNWLDLQGSDE